MIFLTIVKFLAMVARRSEKRSIMNAPDSLSLQQKARTESKRKGLPQPAWFDHLRPWFTERLAASFVLITLFTMIGGLVADWQEQPTFATVLYTIAYATGGYYGLKGSLESLREG